MDDPAGIADGMAEAALILMLRTGTITPEAVVALAEEYDRKAGWEKPHEAERLQGVAHRLRLATLSTDPAPMVDPAADFRAKLQREQIRERTARLTAVKGEADPA